MENLTYISLFVLLLQSHIYSQTKKLEYIVLQNRSEVGKMTVYKIASASKTEYSLVTEAKKRVVLMIEVYEKHTQVMINNNIRYASAYRALNGKAKMNKEIEFTDSGCVIKTGTERKLFRLPAPFYSVLNLYFFEPENVKEVFSDNTEKMIGLQKTANKTYKLLLPDGDCTYYYNETGLCSKVIVNKTWYTLEFILKKTN